MKGAVEAAINPLKVELATLKAITTARPVDSVSNHPVSRALSLKPAELMQKSQAQKPSRKYTQIEKLSRVSTGASSPEEFAE